MYLITYSSASWRVTLSLGLNTRFINTPLILHNTNTFNWMCFTCKDVTKQTYSTRFLKTTHPSWDSSYNNLFSVSNPILRYTNCKLVFHDNLYDYSSKLMTNNLLMNILIVSSTYEISEETPCNIRNVFNISGRPFLIKSRQ